MRSMIIVCVLLVVFGRGIDAAGGSVGEHCAENIQKVTTCLTFATGKAETPTKDCCGAVSDIKDSNPVCLCYIIEQIHNGTNPNLKRMGIQEARLLQLPSACKLANANSTDCPKLLHLAPNSPEASVFTNISASITPSAPSGTSLPTTGTTPSDGIKRGPQIVGSLAMAMAIFFSAFCT